MEAQQERRRFLEEYKKSKNKSNKSKNSKSIHEKLLNLKSTRTINSLNCKKLNLDLKFNQLETLIKTPKKSILCDVQNIPVSLTSVTKTPLPKSLIEEIHTENLSILTSKHIFRIMKILKNTRKLLLRLLEFPVHF